MFLTSRLGRYLLIQNLSGFGIAAGVIGAAIVLIDALEQLRLLGEQPDGALFKALGLVAMRLPSVFEAALPFVVLAGVMITFWRLARRSEVTAIRAAGVSAWRFLSPTAAMAAVIGVVAFVALNPIGERLEAEAELRRADMAARPLVAAATQPGTGWSRLAAPSGEIFVRAGAVSPDGRTLTNATFVTVSIRPDGSSRFLRRIDAATATQTSDGWVARGARITEPGQPLIPIAQTTVEADLRSQTGDGGARDPADVGFWSLWSAASQAKAGGLDPTGYDLRFHSLLALPVTLTAMALLSALFSLGVERFGGRVQRAIAAVSIGLAVHFSSDITRAFADAGLAPAWAAAWIPPTCAAFAALYAISAREDG